MQTLSNDIIIEITDYLDLKSLLIYNTLNKDIFNLLDNNFYQNLAYKMYTKEFWDKAIYRPATISIPLKLWKYEIKRIETFQTRLEEVFNKRWSNDDFYNYWSKQLKISEQITMV